MKTSDMLQQYQNTVWMGRRFLSRNCTQQSIQRPRNRGNWESILCKCSFLTTSSLQSCLREIRQVLDGMLAARPDGSGHWQGPFNDGFRTFDFINAFMSFILLFISKIKIQRLLRFRKISVSQLSSYWSTVFVSGPKPIKVTFKARMFTFSGVLTLGRSLKIRPFLENNMDYQTGPFW